ncbi:MAG: short-chain dehydrogenase [Flavobacteriaceae bacterium]|nr:short-chain dehydrogenase [Flavobacteriaceae bacterium]
MERGKWAVIIGGSSGLGLASAKQLASIGYNICILHRDRKSHMSSFQNELELIKSTKTEVITFNKDALKKETIEIVLSKLPRNHVGVLIHSIAKGSLKPMQADNGITLTDEDLHITLNAMAINWYTWSKALKEGGYFSDNSRNISFTSEGSYRVWPNYAAVSAAKATLEALMRQMAVSWAPAGITTNCIQAGTTHTPSLEAIPDSDRLIELASSRNPMGRLTEPEDVANAVALLCSKDASWINGTILKVDGGESLR